MGGGDGSGERIADMGRALKAFIHVKHTSRACVRACVSPQVGRGK